MVANGVTARNFYYFFIYSTQNSARFQIGVHKVFKKRRLESQLNKSVSRGLFINSFFSHCQTEMQELWFMPNSPSFGGITIAIVVGDWFFKRKAFQEIDRPLSLR